MPEACRLGGGMLKLLKFRPDKQQVCNKYDMSCKLLRTLQLYGCALFLSNKTKMRNTGVSIN